MTKKFFVGYVINASYADPCTALDEDWLGDTKIFDYFTLKIKKEMQK